MKQKTIPQVYENFQYRMYLFDQHKKIVVFKLGVIVAYMMTAENHNTHITYIATSPFRHTHILLCFLFLWSYYHRYQSGLLHWHLSISMIVPAVPAKGSWGILVKLVDTKQNKVWTGNTILEIIVYVCFARKSNHVSDILDLPLCMSTCPYRSIRDNLI